MPSKKAEGITNIALAAGVGAHDEGEGAEVKRLIGEVLEVNEAERGNHDYSSIVKGWLPACAGKQSSVQLLVVWVIAVFSSCSLAG